ncbi:glycosyltransferase family 25 protein [Brucella intermedia]|uniref:glycosyltransferase family 25 protein n=1 Tax=Brucella intermedia TaxID=94625 RepID=UPI00235F759D|nr:glycosyltransferase family 25 protein [Brucella intermedia]
MRSVAGNSKALGGYILTIDAEDGARRTSAARTWSASDVAHRFVNGYTAECTPQLLYSRQLNWLRYRRPMSTGEVAVYAGHRRIWQKVIDDGVYVGLSLEDDATIVDVDKLHVFLSDVLLHLDYRSWDIIKLYNFNSKTFAATRIFGSSTVVYHPRPPSGAVGYLIKPSAAKRLLQRKVIYRPIDDDFSYPWELGLRIWSASENLLEEKSSQLGGSLIEKDRHSVEVSTRHRILRGGINSPILKLEKRVLSTIYARKILTEGRGLSNGWS